MITSLGLSFEIGAFGRVALLLIASIASAEICERWLRLPRLVGVQWHPEFHAPLDARLLPREPLINAFLKAAAIRAAES